MGVRVLPGFHYGGLFFLGYRPSPESLIYEGLFYFYTPGTFWNDRVVYITLEGMRHSIGDIIILDGSGVFAEGLKCEVMEVSPEDGRVLKMKAIDAPDWVKLVLWRKGFLKEDNEAVAVEWPITQN